MPPSFLRLAASAAFLPAGGVLAQSPVPPAAPALPAAGSAQEGLAQEGPAHDTRAPHAGAIQQVEVKGSASRYDPRRDDTAGKTVLNADEIRKYGDDNVYDVLKRAPGVTVTDRTIRMRGLGAGYTQILVDGDRPPPGFALDALHPDQIERIEVIRAASAEYSMQAIAGTINIVLRKAVAKPQRELRLNATDSPVQHGGSAGGTWGDRTGAWSYAVSGTVVRGHNDFASSGSDRLTAPDGTVTQARLTGYRGGGPYRSVHLLPRATWKIDDANELTLAAGLQASSHTWKGATRNDNLAGAFGAPDWIDIPGSMASTQWMLRGEAGWTSKIAGGKLTLNLAGERSRDDSHNVTDYYSAGRAHHLLRDWDTVYRPRSTSLRAKFTRALADGHALATGVDASRQRHDDTRLRVDRQDDGPPARVVEGFAPAVTRLAAFIQDEWTVDPQLSVVAGARWEGVRTVSAAAGLAPATSRSRVSSPVAQALYKFPQVPGLQARLALARTYKAPTVDQLTARRYFAPVNTRFSPDASGNPGLTPELARGIDVALERFWTDGALVSVSGAQRLIGDTIRTRLDQDADGRWTLRPLNDGAARVRSLEAEARLPLARYGAALAGTDVRASVARNWSQVARVPGPDNRLDGQTPLSATAGIDYRKDRLSAGTSLAFQRGGFMRISAAQGRLAQTRRDLDLYAAWNVDARLRLRFTLNNLLGTDTTSENVYADAAGVSRQTLWQRGATRAGLGLEWKP